MAQWTYDHRALKAAIVVDREMPVVRLMERTGLTRNVINHVLEGRRAARVDVLLAILNASDVDPRVVFPRQEQV